MYTQPRIFVALAAGLSALAFSASASAASFSGVVVHKNVRAHSFVVALRGGALRAVHARRSPALGRHVSVQARHLGNGTWALQHIRVGGTAARVRVRGAVTYVSSRRGVFVVSARGVSLLVRQRNARVRLARAAADTSVAEGEVVTVDGTLDGDSVDASDVERHGEDTNGLDLEGTVQSIDTTARTLSLSADDSDESGSTLIVDVPAAFDMSLFSTGESVELIVSPNGDGTFTLEQSSDDNGAQKADNPGEDQGDDQGDHHDSAQQACTAEENDPNFASTHNGETFGQFYNAQDPNNVDDALHHCIDSKAQQDGQDSGGSDSSGQESSGSDSSGSGSSGSGSIDSGSRE